MAKLTLKHYFETGGASFSLLPEDSAFITHSDLTVDNPRWYRYFTRVKAKAIKVPTDVLALDRRGLDCLAFARFCLAEGGKLIIPADIGARPHLASLIDSLSPLGMALVLRPESIEAHVVEASIPAARRDRPIYVVGDSHVRFLAGRDEISGAKAAEGGVKWYEDIVQNLIGVHLGASLAYGIGRHGSQTKSTEKIERLLENGTIPKGADIMFSFGEIDCRSHVVRQSELQGVSIDQVVAGLCDGVIAYMDRLASAGYAMHCWGVVAPSWIETNADPRFPISGSFEQRKHATALYNARMRALCSERGYGFLSVEHSLYDEVGMTNRNFYCDHIHLSQAARPLLWREIDRQAAL